MITPVVVLRVKPAGTVTPVKVTVLKVVDVNKTPFTVSLNSTLVVEPPGVPLIGVGVSFTASIEFTIKSVEFVIFSHRELICLTITL